MFASQIFPLNRMLHHAMFKNNRLYCDNIERKQLG